MEASDRFARQLAENHDIPEDRLEKAIAAVEKGESADAAQSLVASGVITEQEWIEEFHKFYGLEIADLSSSPPDKDILKLVSPAFANEHCVIPARLERNTLYIATPLPLRMKPLQEISASTGMSVKAALARRAEILSAIRDSYGVGAEIWGTGSESGSLEILKPDQSIGDAREMAEAAPVVRFVDQIILEAFRDRATDIHIEPFDKELRIRYRIDGALFEVNTPPGIQQFQASIVSRIKIMASMDIAEKRLPQDGRVKLRVSGEELDLRVATLPSSHGEAVSIRLLRRQMLVMDVADLGVREDALERINSLIDSPHGIILVTGPTGSGKTTTLYSFLSRVNTPEKKVITIEDPVEYDIPGITQVQVRPRVDLNFANGLRSMLRHDPDVIMVGEIRDQETARMAIQAALTGHLVFSTLHTNDAPGAITRLRDMGVMPYLIASSLRAVIAQRLVRALCPHCREKYTPDPATVAPFGVSAAEARRTVLWGPKGCDACRHTGYRGRTGVFETLEIKKDIRNLILDNASLDEIRFASMRDGMLSLMQDGWLKIIRGITTPEEVLKTSQEETI